MILVTGGAGYIGSHCVLALIEKGFAVHIFDNLSTGHIETVETLKKYGNVTFTQGDLQNYEEINNVFKENSIDAVLHFAASSLVEESVKNPEKYYYNNIFGTLNLLKAMKENNTKKIVFSSTAATYGEPTYVPIDEKAETKPINPYGKTKLMIEKIMDDYDKAYGLKSVRLRYFNTCGADKEARIGEWHEIETHLIPNILKSAKNANKTFELYGDRYKTKDGTCVRDYIDVEDLAKAHIAALDYLNNGGKTDFFNLGTKTGYTVKEVFAACEKITGKQIPIKIMPNREGDPAQLTANNEKAKEILKWTPEKSLEDSIKHAYQWELRKV